MYKHLGNSGRRERIERIARRIAAMAVAVPVAPYALSQAMAQEAPPPESGTPETIVITASKRSESLQSSPMSVTALTGDQLTDHQVTSLDDYVKMLPSVSYQSFGPSQSQISMRGITTGGDGVAVGPVPTVGVYVDETPVTTIFQSLDIHTYDMARIEALSGPQGTLYGASSLSGTLRLITNKPVIGKWEGGVDVGASKFGPGDPGGSFEGFVNVPISDRMAARVVAFVEHDGGYINNTPANRTYQRPYYPANTPVDANGVPTVPISTAPLTVNNNQFAENNFNSVDSYGGRAQLKINLDENWTLTPAVFMQNQLARGTFLFDPNAGDLNVHDFGHEFNRDDWELASLTLQGKVSDWDMTYNGAYLSRRVDNILDYSYFSVAYDQLAATGGSYAGYTYLKDSLGNDINPTQMVHTFDQYLKQSHELRFSSPADRPWRMTVGAYMQRQIDKHIADYRIVGLQNAAPPPDPNLDFPPSSIPGAPPEDVFYTDARRVDRDYALFGEGALDLTKQLTLIAGVRGFVAYNTMAGFSGSAGGLARAAAALGCPPATATVVNCPNFDKTYHETGETHKLELKWQMDPAKMLYFIYSTGFRPGGNNREAFSGGKTQNVPPYKADTLSNYEVGWKTSWLDRTLYVNGALFWEEWKDVQYSLPGILGIYYTVNAGKARSQGIESQVTWKATHALTLSANGAWLFARLTTPFCDQVNGCDPATGGRVFAPAGTQLPINPRLKLNGNARYNFTVDQYDAYVQGGFNFQGATIQQLRTDWEQIVGPTTAFMTFDLSGGLTLDRYSVTAYLNNMFDRRGILSKNQACVPSDCGPFERLYPTKPQEFGLKVGYKF